MSHARSRRPLLVLAGTLIAVLMAAAALAPGGHAASLKTCKQPAYPGSGYFTAVRVGHTDCTTGRKVTLAYYHCRTKQGRKGWCHRRVLGFSCKETRYHGQVSYQAKVTCNRGRAEVVTYYQQNT